MSGPHVGRSPPQGALVCLGGRAGFHVDGPDSVSLGLRNDASGFRSFTETDGLVALRLGEREYRTHQPHPGLCTASSLSASATAHAADGVVTLVAGSTSVPEAGPSRGRFVALADPCSQAASACSESASRLFSSAGCSRSTSSQMLAAEPFRVDESAGCSRWTSSPNARRRALPRRRVGEAVDRGLSGRRDPRWSDQARRSRTSAADERCLRDMARSAPSLADSPSVRSTASMTIP